MSSAILIVDPQNDFCPGGALAVGGGEEIMPVLNDVIRTSGYPVYVSRDWHPAGSAHFARWPAHCVAGTPGAEFHRDLALPGDAVVISKGTDPKDDGGYSAFEGTELVSDRSLAEMLRAAGVTHLIVGGLATDYCVRASVLDALEAGLHVTVLADGVRGIDLAGGDLAFAVAEMAAAGARFTRSADLVREVA